MMFQQLAILGLAFATGISGMPAPTESETAGDLVITDTIDLGVNGTLTYWSEATTVEARSLSVQLDPRVDCGGAKVECYSNYNADSNSTPPFPLPCFLFWPDHSVSLTIQAACQSLIDSLYWDNGASVGPSPRSICLTLNSRCCISWSKNVGQFPANYLWWAANAVEKTCARGLVDGIQRNTNLNGGCVTQCLSNRPNGCS